MKKILRKVFVNYGGIIFFYLAVIIATFSLTVDYNALIEENSLPITSSVLN